MLTFGPLPIQAASEVAIVLQNLSNVIITSVPDCCCCGESFDNDGDAAIGPQNFESSRF